MKKVESAPKLLNFTKLRGLLPICPQPFNIFTQIYLPYLWHFTTLSLELIFGNPLTPPAATIPCASMLRDDPSSQKCFSRQMQSLIVLKICSWLRRCAAECGHLISLNKTHSFWRALRHVKILKYFEMGWMKLCCKRWAASFLWFAWVVFLGWLWVPFSCFSTVVPIQNDIERNRH